MTGKIILVEDEELLGTMLEMTLSQEGFEVVWDKQGTPLLARQRAATCDLIVLDIMLPDIDGSEILRRLRKRGISTPVLMLTAKGDLETKVESLDIGADDYLTKPFDIAELLARIRALIRRSTGKRHLPSSDHLQIGNCTINLETRKAQTLQGEVLLSMKEVELIALFVRNLGKNLSRADVLENIWGMDVSVTERTVDNFIVRFRKLFEPDPDRPVHFITVRGVGYRLDA